MCGIIGLLGHPDMVLARRFRDRLAHRGPDAEGEWSDQAAGIWLGHRRLSIVDLSEAGAQPMTSPNGRYVITYNGEVYNKDRLRPELEAKGYAFRGHSDTEVIVTAIEAWGLEAAVSRFIGMFAFAAWDREERVLWLVRDRLGIKPLYYARNGGQFAFASELHALKDLPWLDQEIDPAALAAYFRYLAIPAPESILRGARKLPPGCMLRWDGATVSIHPYWTLRQAIDAGRADPFPGNFGEAADELEALIEDSVRLRFMADVPLGGFLSGGVDSSTVAAIMQKLSTRPIKTFTIGFAEEGHNEAPHARAVAEHLGTDHQEITLSPSAALELIPHVGELHDEPFADGSSVPTYLLCRWARNQVTVVLSGDGGDELFGGYPRYFWAERIANWRRRLGPAGAQLLGAALRSVPAGFWDGPITRLGGHKISGAEGLSDRIRRLCGYLTTTPESVYEDMMSAWRDPTGLLGAEPQADGGPHPEQYADLAWAEQMMAVDQGNYMVDDILTKVDRTSMAVSLEVRVPLLDHRILEFAWRLPAAHKLAATGDRGKLLLREVLYRHVPQRLIERPKMGFGMPMNRWLRGPLRDWAESLLSPERLKGDGMLNAGAVRRVWAEHLAGQDRLPQLWTVLMFLQWRERWRT